MTMYCIVASCTVRACVWVPQALLRSWGTLGKAVMNPSNEKSNSSSGMAQQPVATLAEDELVEVLANIVPQGKVNARPWSMVDQSNLEVPPALLCSYASKNLQSSMIRRHKHCPKEPQMICIPKFSSTNGEPRLQEVLHPLTWQAHYATLHGHVVDFLLAHPETFWREDGAFYCPPPPARRIQHVAGPPPNLRPPHGVSLETFCTTGSTRSQRALGSTLKSGIDD